MPADAGIFFHQPANTFTQMNHAIAGALRNAVPYKLFAERGVPLCRWLELDAHLFTEPFFEETIGVCRRNDARRYGYQCVSSVDVLPEWSVCVKSIPPSAIIFHASRCGSTLVSQLLALSRRNVVLSEVPFFDEILRKIKSKNTKERLLKAAIALYAQQRNPHQAHVFIKTDSWHVFFYQHFRKLYPGTPFILLYRRPDEIIRSQQKQRGMQAVPGLIEPGLFGFTKKELEKISLDEYMADVLQKYFEAFASILQTDSLALPVNYSEGGLSLLKKIARVSGVSFDEEELRQMQQRSRYHAKYPDQIFTDEERKGDPPAYCREAFKAYEVLETTRLQRLPPLAE